ncbi:hypothetical protein M8312_00550 [Sphingomonas sp. KRR8]|uniref:hypothetical protein n=1 Tax=Sphingomonas sp. KRR8 TaxID=2942996 RepID=UPI002021FDFD|nr:hypothetical protein [Sphingomonas sp. KRR8]URD61045.1 hypothetical protein M8312_00550 [Sphingomonas sp. KRR8]
MKALSVTAALLSLLVASASHARDREPMATNTLTQGMVQLTLKVGQTTQYEVVQAFGGPNISTIDGEGREVWVYDRHATVTYDKSSGFSIGMLLGAGGGNVGAGGGLGFGSSKSRSESSSRTMTLIIKFGPDKRVVDFNSRTSSF